MKVLYLCEKPSQARDIAAVLGARQRHDNSLEGDNVIVTWCLGHLLETVWPEHYCPDINPWRIEKLPVIPEKWELVPVEKTKKQLTAVKKLVKAARHIVIATDADREGELIAREILEYCHYQGSIERLWLSALDDASIRKALANLKPDSETRDLYYAGLGRQRADWLIGLNMTMAATCLFQQGKGALSVGRVQTPTLKLVVDRDRAIEHFKPQDYFVLLAQFASEQGELFWTKWQAPASQVDEEGRCLDKGVADTFAAKIAQQRGSVASFKEALKKTPPPLGLSLSNLQKLASSRFGFSAKQTLDVAQALYETHKATTYPRSDCPYLPTSQLADVGAILTNLGRFNPDWQALCDQCDSTLQSPIWDNKKITAHHAIIPTTGQSVDIGRFSADEYKLYEVIVRYYLAQFLGDYEYSNRTVIVLCQGESFRASSNTPLVEGWRRVLQSDEAQGAKKADEDDHLSLIPVLAEKENVTHAVSKVEAKQTKPPAPFTEGTLIDAMKNISRYLQEAHYKKILKETAGIGTEATRAAIMETLVKREYLTRKGKHLLSTAKGRHLIDCLPAIVTDPALTAHWEQELEAIAHGDQKLSSFLFQQTESLQTMLAALVQTKAQAPPAPATENTSAGVISYACSLCQSPLRRRQNQKDKSYFWGCSRYPDCRQSYPDEKGKPLLGGFTRQRQRGRQR